MKIFIAVTMFLIGSSYLCFAQLPPTISTDPDTILVYLPPGGSTPREVVIHNLGDSTLTWEAMVIASSPLPPDCTCTECYPDSGEVEGGGIDTIHCDVYECQSDTHDVELLSLSSNDPVTPVDTTNYVELLLLSSNDPVTPLDTTLIIINVVVGIEDKSTIPTEFEVSQNYPNPFNPVTTISYHLPQPGYVELTVFDNLGRSVRTLTKANKPPGNHEVLWDGRNDAGTPVGSGTYIYRLRVGKNQVVRKMVLLR